MVYQAFFASLPSHIPVSKEDRGVLVQPQSTDDVALIVKTANTAQVQLAPDLGQSDVSPEGILLDFSRLNGVSSYRSEELLITVETGIRVDQLIETLNAQDQRMAHLYPKSRTLLSVLGEAPLNLSETRHGALHQWVVGIEAVTGDGEYIHYGGEVVKNVTGYDLNKLFVGSHHRFGVITRAILKVEPKAEANRTFLFHVEELQHALELTQTLMRMLRGIEVLTLFRTKTTFGWQILISLSGYRDIVHQESETVHDIIAHLNADLQELYLAPKALEQWVQRLDWTHPEEPDALVLRIALPYKQMMDLPYRLFQHPWLKTADLVMPVKANQLLLRWISVNIPQKEQLLELKAQIEALQGFVHIVRLPAKLALDVDRFNANPQPVLQTWTHRLKQQFDPNDVLVGGTLAGRSRYKETV